MLFCPMKDCIYNDGDVTDVGHRSGRCNCEEGMYCLYGFSDPYKQKELTPIENWIWSRNNVERKIFSAKRTRIEVHTHDYRKRI